MARGKLKFRDVVGGGRKKNKDNNKQKKVRPRKTYSLYKKDNSKNDTKKRKFVNKKADSDEDVKRQKVEKTVKRVEESTSESEEEVEDNLKQLLATFSGASNKKSLAIDSSDESSEEKELAEEGDIGGNESEELPADDEEVEAEADTPEIDLHSIEAQDDIEDNLLDPFIKHVKYDLHENLLNSLQNQPPTSNISTENWPQLAKLIIQIPKYEETQTEDNKSEFSIAEIKKFAPAGAVPRRNAKLSDLFIKTQIVNNLAKANPAVGEKREIFTDFQAELFSIINNYQDLYFSQRSFSNAEEIRFVYCLHAVNHILKTRMRVIHHNVKLSKKDDVPEDFRDQGLVRPKILIIAPFRDSAHKIIQTIINILLPEDKGNVMNKKRFLEEFTGNKISMPKKNPKPEDYELTFTGNTSDDFRIGMTVTKKSLKLYADFYSSDIIVASPLGLRTIIGAEGEAERNFDFLASIELLILDQTDLFLMQNWDHLIHVFNHLHLQPKESHGTDFSRVRTWSLNGWAKYYRQTLIFSSVVLPEINSLFNKKCTNFAGKVKGSSSVDFGSIVQVFVQLPHVFHKFEVANVREAIDARFEFFKNKILPQQRDTLMRQTLIYVANYFDYVRLRNFFKREEISFVQICEYSKEGKVARARDMFYHGDAHFLLYTERHHFFNRIRIKGIRHLVFYQPPNFPHFYYEMCNLMQEANMNKKVGNMSNMTVTVLYSKYDIHQLAALVGTERAAKLSQSDRNVHMMMTGAD